MVIHTASEGITLAKKLENDSANFYEDAAKKIPTASEVFLNYAKENKKNITQIERAYYGVITDALEGCFAFNLDPDNYALDTSIPNTAGNGEIISRAEKIEGKIISFYKDAAEQSKSLMADVPRNFALIARKREARKSVLAALANG